LFRWEVEDEAEQTLADLPGRVRRVLAEFMDAVVIVDPMEYGRYPGEPSVPLRSLCFGPHDEGLVTFLVWPPDDLVLVTRIQWLGG
jgi:hypothetical protein